MRVTESTYQTPLSGSCQLSLTHPQSASSANRRERQSWHDFVVEVDLESFESTSRSGWTEVKELMTRPDRHDFAVQLDRSESVDVKVPSP